jgi:predicted secreted protein
MTAEEERAYVAGRRAAMTRILMDCARELGYDDPLLKAATLIEEHENARAALRRICAEHGDNDWRDSEPLADVIADHLECYLDEGGGDE